MGRRRTRISLILLVAGMAGLPLLTVQACGPEFPTPIFTNFSAPDGPIEPYAEGNLGLLEPGYQHLFLYLAYRNLIGKPFGDKVAKSIWGSGAQPDQGAVQTEPTDWIKTWTKARTTVAGDSAPNIGFHDDTGIYRAIQKPGMYFEYYNCLQGAFQNAVGVLNQRIRQFGIQSPYIRQWVGAQDQVFENCSAGMGFPPKQVTAVIPAAAPESAPQVIRDDRAYQIAAAHFYAGDFEEARTEFAAIASDPTSQYHTIAPYLVARTLIREGTLNSGTAGQDDQALTQAREKLDAIIADKNLSQIHDAARALRGFVEIRLDPYARAKELETALLSDNADADFRRQLTDYLWLLDNSPDVAVSPGSPVPIGAQQAGDMTDWIATFQSGAQGFQHSLAKWETTKSLAWLVAAISEENPNDSNTDRLELAALNVAPDSPAYMTVTFHRLRLLAESGREEEARKGIDAILATRSTGLSQSARNEFLALRMSLSTSLQDLLRYAARVPSEMSNDSPGHHSGSLFDSDAAVVLSEDLPLQMLADAAHSTALPEHLRREIAIAAWTRAILLNDDAVAREITPRLAALAPQLQNSLSAYASEKNSSSRRFAGVFLILHFPGLRPIVTAGLPRFSFDGGEQLNAIDPYRDNWWCMIGPPTVGTASTPSSYTSYANLNPPLREIYPDGKIPMLAFLNASQREALAKDRAALQALPSASTWLTQRVLNWAKNHANDVRVPEALHDAVRATRYGCVDVDSGKFSKQAFELLHSRYPNSLWTKRTPYWFNN